MKKEEAILVSAFTGFLLTKDFSDVHGFIEKIFGRPVWTHEMADEEFNQQLREKLKPMIIKMIEEETE